MSRDDVPGVEPAEARAGGPRTDPFVAMPEEPGTSGQHPPPASLRPPAERSRAVLLELLGPHPGEVFTVYPSGTLIGRGDSCDIKIGEATLSWEHVRLVTRSDGVYAEDLGSRNGSFINDQQVQRPTLLADGDYLRLGGGSTIFKFSMMEEFEERALRALFELTLRDSLTRLYNRRYLTERLSGELGFAQRQGTELSLLLIDIDHFKAVTDKRGQQVGEAVLKLIASSIQKMMRPEDVLARYADQQFVVLARATSLRNLEILGERFCSRIAALSQEPSLQGLSVTVSVGIACSDPEEARSAESLLAAASSAVLAAKAQGGNRVHTVSSAEQLQMPRARKV